jgi:hypothetical protein
MSNAPDDVAVTRSVCDELALARGAHVGDLLHGGAHNAASYRWLALIAELDRRRGWADDSAQSCAHWLGWKCGVALGAAREKVRVARALESLPRTSAAMASGQLSYSKVREITRVACAETEDFLLQIAEHGTAQHVESFVRAFRRCQQVEELSREARQRRNRALTHRYDDDGSLVIHARLPAEIGALFVQALRPERPSRPRSGVHAARTRSVGSRRASSLTVRASGSARIGIRSSCMSTRRRSGRARPGAASSSAVRRLRWRRPGGSRATRAWSRSWRVRAGSRSMSDAGRARSRHRCAGCCVRATGAVAFRAVRTIATSMRTTSSTGPTAGRRTLESGVAVSLSPSGGARGGRTDPAGLRFVRLDGLDVESTGYMQPRASWSELRSSHEKAHRCGHDRPSLVRREARPRARRRDAPAPHSSVGWRSGRNVGGRTGSD